MDGIKVALVHDWFPVRRGGEKVFEVFAELFPKAPIYSLFHFPGSQIPEIEERTIRTSFIQHLPFLRSKFRHYLPLFPLAAELFNLQEYDLILSSSHCVAKGIIPRPDALHISYIHSPVRYAWNQYFAYFGQGRLGSFSRLFIPPIIHYLRMWDVTSSNRADYFIANSRAVARRITRYWGRPAEVVYPFVDTDYFTPTEGQKDYFLIVSALVPYKRIDLAIKAFNRRGIPLKIVGQGPEYKKLRKIASSEVEFCGPVKDKELLSLYRGARALLLPGEEDFGITPLEAQACGVPVIAYGRGGALDTVIQGETGVLFDEASEKALLDALDNFSRITFNRQTIRGNALAFSREIFKTRIQKILADKWRRHKGSI